MNRKEFLQAGLGGTAVLAMNGLLAAASAQSATAKRPPAEPKSARAITMWDFSWLERRWDGAGYEDWDVALDELVERGYDAVRIDAYPHLVANSAEKTWTLLPQWNTQDWGSPDINQVQVMPALLKFLEKCRDRDIKVGLSTWYRKDADNTRLKITGPEVMADYWIKTLNIIQKAGLLDAVLYVDLCNEWPLFLWAPFFAGQTKSGDWSAPDSRTYMKTAIARVRQNFTELPLLFSFFNARVEDYLDHDMSHFDLFEHHIWMAQANEGEFYKLVGYDYERFDLKGYNNMSLKAEATYRARPDYWQGLLMDKIDRLAKVGASAKKPLVTTECWGPVDYKDWPRLDWGWVKEICALGTERAAGSGQWLAISTSNFCGPQFKGMWREKAYHQRLTQIIKASTISPDLRTGRLWARL